MIIVYTDAWSRKKGHAVTHEIEVDADEMKLGNDGSLILTKINPVELFAPGQWQRARVVSDKPLTWTKERLGTLHDTATASDPVLTKEHHS